MPTPSVKTELPFWQLSVKALMERLNSSPDGLSRADVFCTDKTGALTEARIHLERHMDPLGRESERVLKLAYFNSFFETGLKSPLDDAILLILMLVAYLLAVEGMKQWFFRRFAAE